MSIIRNHTVFYRGTTFQHYYCNDSALRHLAAYGRLSLYDLTTHGTIVRKACNIYVLPLEIEDLLFKGRPWSYRSNILHEIYIILQSIPLHLPLHIDFNNYPELFI